MTGSIFAETQLARLALIRGDVDSAIDNLTGVVDEAVSVGTASFGLEAAIYLAEAHVRRDEAHRALEILESAERTLGLESSPLAAHLTRVRALALRQTGDLEAASEQLDLALLIARRQRLLYEEVQTLRAARGPRLRRGAHGRAHRGAGRGRSPRPAPRCDVLADPADRRRTAVYTRYTTWTLPARDDGLTAGDDARGVAAGEDAGLREQASRLARIDQAVRHRLEIPVEERGDVVVEERTPAGRRGFPA